MKSNNYRVLRKNKIRTSFVTDNAQHAQLCLCCIPMVIPKSAHPIAHGSDISWNICFRLYLHLSEVGGPLMSSANS
jgi:hypothetical protein